MWIDFYADIESSTENHQGCDLKNSKIKPPMSLLKCDYKLTSWTLNKV